MPTNLSDFLSGSFVGESGFSGATGPAGTSGFSGFSGINGVIGSNGASGFSGTSGFSGISGFSGVGVSGFSGFSGAPGAGSGSANVINSTFTTTSTLLYPVMIGAANTNSIANVASNLTYNAATSTLSIRSNLNFISPNSAHTITINKLDSDTLSFSGNSGQLFSITDTLANGSIFSVNDISGLPVIDVDANGWISLVQYGGNVRIYNAATSTSNTTGALIVDGGVGVKGNVFLDRVLFSDGTSMNTAASGTGGSGSSGFSGFSGVSGFSGISGFSGRSGFSGESGFSGVSGFSGANPGASGFSGFSGAAGEVSLTGTQTLTNKRINPRAVPAGVTSGNLTINGDTTDLYEAEGLTGAITFLQPSGTPDINNVPLAQDTIIIDNNSSGSFQATNYNCPTIDASSRTTTQNFFFNGNWTLYGGLKLSQAGTCSSAGFGIFFLGRGNNVFNQGGIANISQAAIDFNLLNGSMTLESAITSDRGITLTSGTFNSSTYNVTCQSFNSNNSNVRTLNMGSGLWTITSSGGFWNMSTVTNLSFIKGTANIIVTDTTTSAKTFAGGGLSYNKFTIGGATGISTLTITGNNRFTELAATKTVAHTIALGTEIQRVDAFTIKGTSGNIVTITGTGSGLIYTGTGNVPGLDYMNIQGRAYGPNGETTGIWYGGQNSINSGSLGWEFTAAPGAAQNSGFFFLFA